MIITATSEATQSLPFEWISSTDNHSCKFKIVLCSKFLVLTSEGRLQEYGLLWLTWSPRCTRYVHKWLPTNPAPPVTSTLFLSIRGLVFWSVPFSTISCSVLIQSVFSPYSFRVEQRFAVTCEILVCKMMCEIAFIEDCGDLYLHLIGQNLNLSTTFAPKHALHEQNVKFWSQNVNLQLIDNRGHNNESMIQSRGPRLKSKVKSSWHSLVDLFVEVQLDKMIWIEISNGSKQHAKADSCSQLLLQLLLHRRGPSFSSRWDKTIQRSTIKSKASSQYKQTLSSTCNRIEDCSTLISRSKPLLSYTTSSILLFVPDHWRAYESQLNPKIYRESFLAELALFTLDFWPEWRSPSQPRTSDPTIKHL